MTRATRVSCVDSIVKMALPDPKTTPGELGTHTGTSAVIWWRNSALHWQLRQIQTGLENRSALTGTQECKKGKTVTIRGKLYGTNTGISAPLTAPFFGRFWGSTGWGNRCMVGSVEAAG